MSQYVRQEIFLFIKSFWYGAFLVLIYDLLRICRILRKSSNLVIAIQDIFFWILASVYLFVMCFADNSGVMRLYLYGATLAGTIVCYYSISRYFIKISVFSCRKVVAFVRIPMKFVEKTIKRLKFWWRRVTILICEKIDCICGKIHFPLTNKGEPDEKEKKRKKAGRKK